MEKQQQWSDLVRCFTELENDSVAHCAKWRVDVRARTRLCVCVRRQRDDFCLKVGIWASVCPAFALYLVILLAKAQMVFVLADYLIDNRCDAPLVCPTLLNRLANAKWWWYPEISQQDRQEKGSVWSVCVSVCVCCGWLSASQCRKENVGGMLTLAASRTCYHSLRGYNKFAVLLCLCIQHRRQPLWDLHCDAEVNKKLSQRSPAGTSQVIR